MTRKIAWVTDTAALLDDAFIEKHQIYVLPVNIIFEEGALRETIDLTHEELYEKLRNEKHPKTAQPAYGEMVELYTNLKKQGYDCAIVVHTSKTTSGTYQGSIMASEQAGFKTYILDSKIASFPMMKMIEIGKQAEAEGHDIETIMKTMDSLVDRAELTAIPASLTQLYRSGRVPGIAALIGNLLKIKLVIAFENGKVVLRKKFRSEYQAKKYLMDVLRLDLAKAIIPEVAIVHCNFKKGALEWKSILQTEFPTIRFSILQLSACIGVHAGEGTIGLSWIRY